jgi:peptidyl-prolyl cis-trans isomerase C
MKLSFGSKSIGTRLTTALLAAIVLLTTATASAQSPSFDKEVLDLLLESRSQKPASQATAEEVQAAADELADIYAVTDHPRAIELGKAPQIRAQLELQERAVLFSAFANDFFAKNQATDQEIFNEYEEQVAINPPREFKARHILVDTQGAAIGLIEELKDGADFVALAKEKSTGPSGPSGGDLGWFTAAGMVKPFSDAVATMEDGAFTLAPVQTQFGWHVILREDSRESAAPPLESVRDVIKQRIEQQKFQDFVANLRTKATE